MNFCRVVSLLQFKEFLEKIPFLLKREKRSSHTLVNSLLVSLSVSDLNLL